jgi:hypothetical protein
MLRAEIPFLECKLSAYRSNVSLTLRMLSSPGPHCYSVSINTAGRNGFSSDGRLEMAGAANSAEKAFPDLATTSSAVEIAAFAPDP